MSFRIVLDPGHGGNDPGAIGPSKLHEADCTYAISRSCADDLECEPGLVSHVVLTRPDYLKTVSLQERCEIAIAARADLLVSIHANSSDSPKAWPR